MAQMQPIVDDAHLDELSSRAEAIVYRACRDLLSDKCLVLHSTTWVYATKSGRVVEGESDFAIFDELGGVLVLEVKGGGIAFDATTAKWTSRDRRGDAHDIKDPFRQASRERHAMIDQLYGSREWQQRMGGRRVLCGHAVCFPDIDDVRPFLAPDRPVELICGRREVGDFRNWTKRAMEFWGKAADWQPLGREGMRVVRNIFGQSVEVKASLAARLADEEAIRVRLTERQAKILRIVGARKRAVIGGGAGTGKTLIALEKMRQLMAAGKRALLVCYNRPLADAMAAEFRGSPGIVVMSFHQLCESRANEAARASGRDLMREALESYPGSGDKHRFDVQMPFALALSAEVLSDRFDAIVVDEAQDFGDEYWFGLEELFAEPEDAEFYLFLDPNQSIYRRSSALPVNDEPFYLTENCRNTFPIHAAAYSYYRGEAVDPPTIHGEPLVKLIHSTDEEQAAAIADEIRRLLVEEKMTTSNIMVLLCRRHKQYLLGLISARKLPSGVTWRGGGRSGTNAIGVETVARFKGLEAPIVFLWVEGKGQLEDENELLYVGLSRAKSRLYLVGTEEAVAAAVRGAG